MNLKVKKLHPDATLPKYNHADDAGMDFFAVEDVELAPGERTSVPTGIAMEIPIGYVGLLWDKSGVAHKGGIKTLGGVIDSGYRGEVKIGVINLSNEKYIFQKGHKVAQMLIQKVEKVEIEEAEELSDTVRGEKGFGSSGK